MADSITLNSMSGGSVVDTEVPSFRGNHIQRVKIAVGAVDSDAGDATTTNPLPVLITNTTVSGITTISGIPTYQGVRLYDANGALMGIAANPVQIRDNANLSDLQSTVNSFTITLASLGSVGTPPNVAGRQSTLVDNTANLYIGAKIYLKLKMGTTPTANTLIYVYLIQYDNSAVADDGAGTTDAALTVVNAIPLGTILNPSTTTGQLVYGVFDTTKVVDSLGPKWGIAIVNTTGAALDSTEGNHTKNWIGIRRQLS